MEKWELQPQSESKGVTAMKETAFLQMFSGQQLEVLLKISYSTSKLVYQLCVDEDNGTP